MENRIDWIMKLDVFDARKAGLLLAGGREAFDRGLIELSETYFAALEPLRNNRGKSIKRQDPYSFTVFYASKPQVIILREKHGDWHYDASTPENAARACLEVLERRLGEGYWYADELPEDKDPGDQLGLFSSNKKPLTEAERAQKILDIARESNGLIFGGRKAFEFLMEFSDGEYQRIEVETANIGKFS